jgi:transcriptional regulator of arginine metabolism
MKPRSNRLMEIRRIIRSSKISSQEELLLKLEKRGYHYTQATLSRDLKFLKVGRRPDDKGHSMYFLPDEPVSLEGTLTGDNGFHLGFRSIEFSRNLAVIKTSPGFASGIAYAIDGINAYEIIGTIAGDDTILLITRDGSKKSDVMNKLSFVVPDIGERK